VNRKLVLIPALRFGELAALLGQHGWTLAQQAAEPLVPGEPEHASFERGQARLVYTCNPVCHFRVLDTALAGAAGLDAALPVVSTGAVADWLASDDERTLLRGLLAAAHTEQLALAPLVQAQCKHPRPAIARAAEQALQVLLGDKIAAGDGSARGGALLAIALLEEQLRPLLMALQHDRDGRLAAALRPQASDFLLAFAPGAAIVASDAYATAPVPRVQADGELELALAPAGMLGDDNALSRRFPGGYRAIAHLLAPQRIWASWKYVRRGERAGVAYDGLVWLDERWVWFPKPYRALSA
jgi:hypothetical protein